MVSTALEKSDAAAAAAALLGATVPSPPPPPPLLPDVPGFLNMLENPVPVVGDFVSVEPGGLTGEIGDRAPLGRAPPPTPASLVARLLLLRGMLSGATLLLSATGATSVVRPLAPLHSGRVVCAAAASVPGEVGVSKLLAAGATTTGLSGRFSGAGSGDATALRLPGPAPSPKPGGIALLVSVLLCDPFLSRLTRSPNETAGWLM